MTVGQRSGTSTVVGLILVAGLTLGACGTSEETEPDEPPVSVEEIDGRDVSQITLSASAVERLGIQTVTVEPWGDDFVVPSAAVIIDPDGVYWVYTNPEVNVFVRARIQPVYEEGLSAIFETGPDVGVSVVIVGVPELYGAEVGIGK